MALVIVLSVVTALLAIGAYQLIVHTDCWGTCWAAEKLRTECTGRRGLTMFGKDTILADIQLLKGLPNNEEVDELELQVRLCKMLGLALSVGGFAGIGSLITLVLGLRGRRVIKHSEGRLGGIWLAWWCIVSGALGTLTGPPLIVILVWRSLR